jgi:hypothetical protein
LWGKISFLKGGIFLGISSFSKGGMGGFWMARQNDNSFSAVELAQNAGTDHYADL